LRAQPEGRRISWRQTIRHARRELAKLLRKYPGLQHHPARYRRRRTATPARTPPMRRRCPPATFPEACPWTLAQVLDADFWPESQPCGSCNKTLAH
jgi:Domain of unknown function DUF29